MHSGIAVSDTSMLLGSASRQASTPLAEQHDSVEPACNRPCAHLHLGSPTFDQFQLLCPAHQTLPGGHHQ